MILSTHGVIASQIQSYAFLLDTYTSAAAAYSLRKLRSAYTGSAIRVRRASDNTETDIGFSSTFGLDTTTLTTFCSGTNGFVTTWYDQSGNGFNVTQTTAASQPQIVSSGSVLTEGGKPMVQFDGSNDRLNGGNILSVGNNSLVSFVVGKATVNVNSFYAKSLLGPSASRYAFLRENGSVSLVVDSNNSLQILTTTAYGTRKLYNQQYIPNLNHKIFVDNTEMISGSATTIGNATFDFLIGGYNDTTGGEGTGLPLNGQIQELIIYLSNQSSNLSAINTNINSYYAIY
jgi:hypothetical protein